MIEYKFRNITPEDYEYILEIVGFAIFLIKIFSIAIC